MGLSSTLGCLLIFLGLQGICTGFVQENCTDYKLQFERVFSVPGDTAMLNSTLVSPDVFDFKTVPYTITWYASNTDEEMTNRTGRILVLGESLWFLNVTQDDSGDYVCIVRTPHRCYRQATKLEVDLPAPGQCGRPRTIQQTITYQASDTLSCPLKDYISKLKRYNTSYSLKWYKGCEPIHVEKGGYSYRDTTKLTIQKVDKSNNGCYTCTLTFTLSGTAGSVSETVVAKVIEERSMDPEVHEPAREIVKAQMGSNFSRRCLVFVPGVGRHRVSVIWSKKNEFILNENSSKRVYTSKQSVRHQDSPREGAWLERMLIISELREEDFNINYTCQALSFRGNPWDYFTLLPEETDLHVIISTGTVLGGVTVLFITSIVIYNLFKVDIVLGFRKAFPVLYKNKDLDGKLYDAYVAYPESCATGFNKEVELFALNMLPQVLENVCGYKLFIAGRDCLPGQAIMDSVEENIQASRRLLLLYTASTFTCKRHASSTSSNDNNNLSTQSNNNNTGEGKAGGDGSCTSLGDGDGVCSNPRQRLEWVAAMHRVLLEASLKVVLVELEEIAPAQLALFPESVRHLRKKQGAVRWWGGGGGARQRWGPCSGAGGDEEKGGRDVPLSQSLPPSSRFWKEMRYNMPVRGKRAVYPEKTALLNVR